MDIIDGLYHKIDGGFSEINKQLQQIISSYLMLFQTFSLTYMTYFSTCFLSTDFRHKMGTNHPHSHKAE